jgi:hypothetical protein
VRWERNLRLTTILLEAAAAGMSRPSDLFEALLQGGDPLVSLASLILDASE